MRNIHSAFWIFPVASVLLIQSAQAQVTVALDRYSITSNETVQLTLEVDQRAVQRPDFSPLTKDFHFLGSKQMTVSSHANGTNQYTTRWRVLLRPRHGGELQIPALVVNQEQSQPLLLSVAGNSNDSSAISRDSYIESNVDTNELYVNSQLLYSQKLFHRSELPPMANFSEPQIDNAQITPLGEINRYSTQLRGEEYQVIEKNYAVFPLRAGQITIPPATFSAGPGATEISSDPFSILVLAKANQKKKGYWLPSRKVSLTDEIDQPAQITPGTPIIRRITVSAVGLPAESLPALMPLRNELADIQISDVSLSQEYNSQGVVSSRTETVIITAKERGEVTLPEIRIPWWNISKDRSEESVLNPLILRVEPAVQQADTTTAKTTADNATATAMPAPAPAALEQASEAVESSQSESPQADSGNVTLLIWLLAITAIISSLGWLYSVASLRKLRQQEQAPFRTLDDEVDIAEIIPDAMIGDEIDSLGLTHDEIQLLEQAEREAFHATLNACEQDQPLEARLFMLDWARKLWPQAEINSSLDLSDIANSKTLDLLIIDMENHIDGTETDYWSGDLLAEALEKIRDKHLAHMLEIS